LAGLYCKTRPSNLGGLQSDANPCEIPFLGFGIATGSSRTFPKSPLERNTEPWQFNGLLHHTSLECVTKNQGFVETLRKTKNNRVALFLKILLMFQIICVFDIDPEFYLYSTHLGTQPENRACFQSFESWGFAVAWWDLTSVSIQCSFMKTDSGYHKKWGHTGSEMSTGYLSARHRWNCKASCHVWTSHVAHTKELRPICQFSGTCWIHTDSKATHHHHSRGDWV